MAYRICGCIYFFFLHLWATCLCARFLIRTLFGCAASSAKKCRLQRHLCSLIVILIIISIASINFTVVLGTLRYFAIKFICVICWRILPSRDAQRKNFKSQDCLSQEISKQKVLIWCNQRKKWERWDSRSTNVHCLRENTLFYFKV